MSDNNQRYFSHDDNARNDPKMIEARMTHGNIAHGIYFMIIELLRQAPDFMIESDPRKIAFQLNEPDVELVRSIVNDFDFFDFYTDEETGKEFITSQSLLNRMEMMKNNSLSDKRKNAAHARWKKKNELANGNSKEGETVNNENQSKDISIDDKKDKNTTIGNSNEVYRLDLSEKEVEEVKKQNKCKTMQVECKPYAKGMQNEFACMQNSFASMQNEFASCKPYAKGMQNEFASCKPYANDAIKLNKIKLNYNIYISPNIEYIKYILNNLVDVFEEENLVLPNEFSELEIKLIEDRISDLGFDYIKESIANIKYNSFALGMGERGWKMDFYWLFAPKGIRGYNMQKIHDKLLVACKRNINKAKRFNYTDERQTDGYSEDELKALLGWDGDVESWNYKSNRESKALEYG